MFNYCNEWNSKISRKFRYGHIDVTLSKYDTECYTVRVTNHGEFPDNILSISHEIFWQFLTTNTVSENSTIATIVFNRNEDTGRQEAFDLNLAQNRLSLIDNRNDKDHIDFSYQKKYLSFLLKTKLMSSEVHTFIKIVINEIMSLQQMKPDTKFTVHVDEKSLCNNYIALDYDYKSCQVLATALTNVIKQSLDVAFKEKCFSLLNVENSHEIESALMIKLLPLIHDNHMFPSIS